MRTSLLAAATLIMIAAAPASVDTSQGVYSETQADEGAALYRTNCAMCHGEALAGSHEVPPLNGRLIANWSNASVGDLYDYVGRAMPLFAPGSLSPEDNARIVAYLLKGNGMPAGAKPLPADDAALKRIRFGKAMAR